MSSTLSEENVALLKEPHLAQFVCLNRDGSPHISPVWVDTDGENVIINTEEKRVKVANIRRDSRVAISVYDPENSYSRVVNVIGHVIEVTTTGARDHIDALSRKYTGGDYGAHRADRERLKVVIKPDRVY